MLSFSFWLFLYPFFLLYSIFFVIFFFSNIIIPLQFSIEIKTSSSQNDIFGNASYGKEDSSDNSTKSKSGYYLAINFDKFEENNPNFKPCIRLIRFGWLDHTDWHSQQKPSGQQSRISREVRDNKLKIIYKNTAINENYEDNNLDNNFLEYFF